MEGILVLKVVGDTSFQTGSLEHLLEVRNFYHLRGYIHANFRKETSYLWNDSLFVVYRFERGFPFVPSALKLEGYYTKTWIYRMYFQDFVGKVFQYERFIRIKDELDEFYELETYHSFKDGFLVLENRKPLIQALGYLSLDEDLNLSGNLELRMDLLEIKYYTYLKGMYVRIPLPLRVPNLVSSSYMQSENYTKWEAGIRMDWFSSGVACMFGTCGMYMGMDFQGIVSYRLEYVSGMPTVVSNVNFEHVSFTVRLSSLYEEYFGGIGSIVGFPEGALSTSNMFLISVHPKFYNVYPIFQAYWLDGSKVSFSFGIALVGRYMEVVLAKGGNNPPMIHVGFRN